MDKLRILFICNEYPPAPYGGIGVFVKTLAVKFVQKGWHVAVIGYNPTLERDARFEDEGVTIQWLRKRNFVVKNAILQELYDRYYLTRWVHKFVREFDPHVVESYDWSGPLLFNLFRAPLVVRMHGAHTAHAFNEKKRRSRFLHVLEKLQFYLADSLVAVSNHMGVTTLKSFGLRRDFKVIYNPIDPVRFNQDLSIEDDENLLLYVGRIHPRKGVLELLKAFNKVVENNHNIILQLAGGGSEAYINELQSLLSVKAQARVRFLGNMPHEVLADLYNRAAVTVFPSRAEAFGITIAESMACGVAPIVTNRASGPEIIEHGETGWLVDVYDETAFCETIREAFSSKEKRIAIGLKAREVALKKYALNTITEENMKLYREIAAVKQLK